MSEAADESRLHLSGAQRQLHTAWIRGRIGCNEVLLAEHTLVRAWGVPSGTLSPTVRTSTARLLVAEYEELLVLREGRIRANACDALDTALAAAKNPPEAEASDPVPVARNAKSDAAFERFLTLLYVATVLAGILTGLMLAGGAR